jgi:elongation factor Ts
MMDCKKALNETNGDLEAAADWLRTKGIAKADKKASRIAAEGLVAVALDGTTGAVVEVNSETDFVARNDGFQAAVAEVSKLALAANSNEELAAAKTASGDDVTEMFKKLVGKIGENMTFRRMAKLTVSDGVVAGYIHNAVTDGMGKIGVLVALESTGDKAKLEDLAKKIAMHVAATNPLALSVDDLDPAVVPSRATATRPSAAICSKPKRLSLESQKRLLIKWSKVVCRNSSKNLSY